MRTAVTIFLYAFLADAAVSVANEWLAALSPARNAVAWLVFCAALVLYALAAFTTLVPKRIVLPAALFLVWANACGGFPLSFIAPQHAGILLSGTQLALAGLLLAVHFRLPRRTAAFSWKNLALVTLLTAVVAPLALAAGTIQAVGTHLEAGSGGYFKVRPGGLMLEEREFAKDGKRVRLVSMMHIGDREFYETIHASLPADGAASVLLEGVTDDTGLMKTRLSYARFANMLGLTPQEASALQQSEPAAAEEPGTTAAPAPRLRYRHADVDISTFQPLTVEFINTIGVILSSPTLEAALQAVMNPDSPLNHPGAEEIVMHDILDKRNDHLVAEIDDALKTSHTVIVPWGAMHLPHIESTLLARGFEETRRTERKVVSFRRKAADAPR